MVVARPEARSFKTVAIESYYGPGVSPDDVFINFVEVQTGNCSFEKGVAQFVPQDETK